MEFVPRLTISRGTNSIGQLQLSLHCPRDQSEMQHASMGPALCFETRFFQVISWGCYIEAVQLETEITRYE